MTVSTLLEILDDEDSFARRRRELVEFQPFLRFWLIYSVADVNIGGAAVFQPFLRFWRVGGSGHDPEHPRPYVSTLLEILGVKVADVVSLWPRCPFQPFLRFWAPAQPHH